MSLVYQNSLIIGSTKVGSIKPDANGYREVVLGAFNCNNSGGAYYPLEPVKNLLLSSSSLMRRLKDRALRSEYGHPRRNGMSPVEFLSRVLDINEQSVCNHILKLELDEERIIDKETNQKVAAIIGWITPSGPYGEALEKQFANPEENVCYSIRSITNDSTNSQGQLIKSIKEIVTWDYVNEPGIKYAKKYYSPSLESIMSEPSDNTMDYTIFNEATILAARDYSNSIGIGNESMNSMFDDLLTKGQVTTPYGTFYKKTASARWKA